MANEATTLGYTFTEAALAAGVTPRTLRNWVDRNQIELLTLRQREAGEWRRFALVDILHLAIVAEMVPYCVPVERASALANEMIGQRVFFMDAYNNTPAFVVRAALRTEDYIFYIERLAGQWQITADAKFGPRDGAGPRMRASYLLIAVPVIVDAVLERLGLEDPSVVSAPAATEEGATTE